MDKSGEPSLDYPVNPWAGATVPLVSEVHGGESPWGTAGERAEVVGAGSPGNRYTVHDLSRSPQ